MNKSITQNQQDVKQISSSMCRFFSRFQIASVLKEANAYKKKGTPVASIVQYLFLLVFTNRSMYMDLITDRNKPNFSKDTVYRFMKRTHINWIHFTSLLASRIMKNAILPLNHKERVNVLIVDDSLFARNRSKKVELLAKIFDHAKKTYCYGFRMLTLGWSDGTTFLPVNSILLSSEHKKSRVQEAVPFDKRTTAYKRRLLAVTKAMEAMLSLLKAAKKVNIPPTYVLFDSWFTSPKSLHAIKEIGYDIIGMVKKTPKMFFGYEGKELPLTKIYQQNRKRRGRSNYLLSVLVDVKKRKTMHKSKGSICSKSKQA